MKKFSLLAWILLLFQISQLQAAPLQSTLVKEPVPIGYQKSSFPVKQPPLFQVHVTNPKDGSVNPIWVRLQYENEYQSGDGLYGDVVARFYEDNGVTPTSVSGLTVNFRMVGYNGTSYFDTPDSTTAYGESFVVAYNQEHDYDDGNTFRYKDYYLTAGGYEIL